MDYFKAIILGLVQGLAEFLPISSSGHLALMQIWFGIKEDEILFFALMLHLGTLISVFAVYWKDIWELVLELIETVKDLCTGKGLRLEERPIRKLGLLIIVASIPTAIIGILFNDKFDKIYAMPMVIGLCMIVTGVMLFFAERVKRSNRTLEHMNFRNAIFIGTVQGIAICPGISRSGSTLFASLLCELKKDFAVKFVFLISIPPILGGAILEIPDALKQGIAGDAVGPLLVGVAVAAVSGYIAIKTMIKVLTKQKLRYFSYYLWVIGAIAVIYGIVI